MFACGNVVYEYDGTLDGFFCCVFESFQKKETPLGIHPLYAPQLTLGSVRSIHTDLKRPGACAAASVRNYRAKPSG